MSDIISKLADLEEQQKPKFPATLNLLWLTRNGNKVKRYHTVDTLVSETVGHHSANVAQIVLALYPACSKELLVAALNHDLAEQYTGDVPATAKWASSRLASALKEVEEGYMLPFAVDLTSHEKCLLKQADMLDLCFKCVEELQLGNKQIRPLIRRGFQFLRENKPSTLTEYIVSELEDSIS
jgi:5'-deoxynucleotidase YfbR-like HD superfamily hydrolase